jgi:hypothetical protein
MCEQACPQHLPLSIIFTHVKQRGRRSVAGKITSLERNNWLRKGMLSQPVSRLQTIVNHFPLPPLKLTFIGEPRH